MVSGNKNNFDFTPSFALKNKKDNIYTLGYGLFNKNINIGFYIKLK